MGAAMKIKLSTIIFCGVLLSSMKNYGEQSHKLPIIFHEKYDISLLGIEKIASFFDTKKYGKIKEYVCKELNISKDSLFEPQQVTDAQLLTVHTKRYLDSLYSSKTIAAIAEVFFLRW